MWTPCQRRRLVYLQQHLQIQSTAQRGRVNMTQAQAVFKIEADKLNITWKLLHCVKNNEVGPAKSDDPCFTNIITALGFLMAQSSSYNKWPLKPAFLQSGLFAELSELLLCSSLCWSRDCSPLREPNSEHKSNPSKSSQDPPNSASLFPAAAFPHSALTDSGIYSWRTFWTRHCCCTFRIFTVTHH